jgi:hypothetical protein
MLRGCALDIGDGACIRIAARRDATLWIDCGSSSGGSYAARRWLNYLHNSRYYGRNQATSLCLTHFHDDHYNGLLAAAYDKTFPRLAKISELVWPRLPAIPETTALVRALYALAVTRIGGLNGVMDADLVVAAQTLKGGPIPLQRRLSQGDTISIASGSLHAIWPPRQLPDRGVAKIREAVADFEDFIRQPRNRQLKQVYEDSEDLKLPSTDAEVNGTNANYVRSTRDTPHRFATISEEMSSNLDLEVINRRIRAAANYCCLAFILEGPGFLCLSDLKGTALKGAVEYLVANRQCSFETMLAPHHGTGSSRNLRKLSAKLTVVSAGKQMARYQKPTLKQISGRIASTAAGRPIWFDSEGKQYFY